MDSQVRSQQGCCYNKKTKPKNRYQAHRLSRITSKMKLLLSATLTSVVACSIEIGNRWDKEPYCGAERLMTSPEVTAGGS